MYGGFFSWGCFNSNAGQPTAEKIELQGTQEPIAEKSSVKDSNGDELAQARKFSG